MTESKKSVDCQVFVDQLDALVRNELPEEGMRQLLHHAQACPDCAMQMKVQEELLGPPLEVLEDNVPEAFLSGMWDRVEASVTRSVGRSGRRSAHIKGDRRYSRNLFQLRFLPRRLVPALAAASLLLLFSTGFLLHQTRVMAQERAILAQQVAEQQRWMAELQVDPSADPVARTAALAGRSPFTRALSRKESISIRSLRGMLERMPGDRVVLNRTQVDAALRSRIPLTPPFMKEALSTLDGQDEVSARDLLQALESLDVNPEMTVPTAELVQLLS